MNFSLKLFRARAYLRHRLQSRGPHGVHSPFVFDFVKNVLPDRPAPAAAPAEALRRHWLTSAETLLVEDHGAGSADQGATGAAERHAISDMVKHAACTPERGRLLHRIVKRYQPATCLELGTNLGISAAYQYTGLESGAVFHTVEGAAALARAAEAGLRQVLWPSENLLVHNALFQDFLNAQPTLAPDYVYLDGHHALEPTLRYFETLAERMPDGSLFVFDDIYWSPGMAEAWKRICQHPEVTVSLDLFWLGVCFLRRPQAKEHFALR